MAVGRTPASRGERGPSVSDGAAVKRSNTEPQTCWPARLLPAYTLPRRASVTYRRPTVEEKKEGWSQVLVSFPKWNFLLLIRRRGRRWTMDVAVAKRSGRHRPNCRWLVWNHHRGSSASEQTVPPESNRHCHQTVGFPFCVHIERALWIVCVLKKKKKKKKETMCSKSFCWPRASSKQGRRTQQAHCTIRSNYCTDKLKICIIL